MFNPFYSTVTLVLCVVVRMFDSRALSLDTRMWGIEMVKFTAQERNCGFLNPIQTLGLKFGVFSFQ